MNIGPNIKRSRTEGGLTLKALSERSGVKVATLSAIEHGRILNPSFENLDKIAGALGVIPETLWEGPGEAARFYQGDLKGTVQLEFKKEGLTLISYTPLLGDLFVGKGFLKARKAFDFKLFPRLNHFFIEVIFGKLELKGDGKNFLLTEGENLFLRGPRKRMIANPLQMKETAFLLVTTPSIIRANLESQKPSV